VQLPTNLWPLVAAAAGVTWPPRDAEALRLFITRCGTESLLPLLFADSPAEVAPALRGWKALQTANERRAGVIRAVTESVPSLVGEEFVFLKGSDYGRRLYPSSELRPQVDIDILVPRERVNVIAKRLEQLGHRRFYLVPSHASQRWPDQSFDLGEVTLELHHSFVQRSRARIDYDEIWQRRRPFANAARLDDADAMLASVINIAKDDLAVPLIRYLDLWLMLQSDPALFDVAARRARTWRIANAFHAVMRTASTLFPDLPVSLPQRALDTLIAPRGAAIRRDRGRNVTRLQLLWRKWWLIDGVARRIGFVLDAAMMSVEGRFLQNRAPSEMRYVRGR
jgi:hypothetical protein